MNVSRKLTIFDARPQAFALRCACVAVLSISAFAQQTDSNSPPQRGGTPADEEMPASETSPESMFPHFGSTRFWLSGQANFIFQTHPEFPALYNGPHSLG
ncbi:MAG TPA: hypothetical protein VJQ54_02770, partial [Candidatus Sulfotelmatobacter sp.]|nr:hypothetical protein [Candidatus Sulfotelmatobacter sp.]